LFIRTIIKADRSALDSQCLEPGFENVFNGLGWLGS
jgi:hypothetical protein